MANVVVTHNEQARRFEVTMDGQTAFADYSLEPGVMVLPHTEVPDAFAGKGIGGALARAALEYARHHGLNVEPRCPFIASYIAGHPEYQDLVRPGL